MTAVYRTYLDASELLPPLAYFFLFKLGGFAAAFAGARGAARRRRLVDAAPPAARDVAGSGGERCTTISRICTSASASRAGRYAVTAEAIKAFAAEFDPQPFHTDEAAAEASFFGGLVASGWHTAAITMRLLVDGALPLAGGAIGAGGEIGWPQATRPGDLLTAESTIEAITPSRSRPDRGMLTVRTETRNQRGEVVQVLVSKVLAFRRPT